MLKRNIASDAKGSEEDNIRGMEKVKREGVCSRTLATSSPRALVKPTNRASRDFEEDKAETYSRRRGINVVGAFIHQTTQLLTLPLKPFTSTQHDAINAEKKK